MPRPWEYGEEVEENHIATVGHRVRPAWMTDEQAPAFESQRDEEPRPIKYGAAASARMRIRRGRKEPPGHLITDESNNNRNQKPGARSQKSE